MGEEAKRLVEVFTNQAMTGEGRASVLGYARGRLDAQRESERRASEVHAGETENSPDAGTGSLDQAAKELPERL